MGYKTKAENKAYYQRRVARAKAHGFSGYSTERRYKESNREILEAVGTSEYWYEQYPELDDYRTLNPQQLVDYYNMMLQPRENLDSGESITGSQRHAAVSYYIKWENMTTDEAVEAMRRQYGPS